MPSNVSSHMELGGSSRAPIVAAFDVDKTLTQRDCVVPYLRRLASWKVAPRLIVWAVPLVWAGVRRDRDRVKAVATRVTMKGLTHHQIESEAERFAQKVIATWLRDDTVRRLAWHRDQGHQIVLVSASYRSYVQHLGAHLGSVEVLACEVGFDSRDRCTGELIEGNCRGPEKERRLNSWLKAQNFTGARIFAYGDSAGDDQLLAMATWPTRVGAKPLSPEPEIDLDSVDQLGAEIAGNAS